MLDLQIASVMRAECNINRHRRIRKKSLTGGLFTEIFRKNDRCMSDITFAVARRSVNSSLCSTPDWLVVKERPWNFLPSDQSSWVFSQVAIYGNWQQFLIFPRLFYPSKPTRGVWRMSLTLGCFEQKNTRTI